MLVTDVEERSSLAACRGLAQAGYHVTGVAAVTPAAGHWSRAVDRRVVLPDPRDAPEAFLAGLQETLERERHAILIPSTDLTLWLVSEARERFEGLVRMALPDREAVGSSLDKRWLVEHAGEAGLAAPASRVCTSLEESLAAAAELGFPVVVKPAYSFTRLDGHFRQERVTLVSSAAEFGEVLPRYGSSFVVQRYIEHGHVVSSSGLMTPDGLLGFAAVRWHRRWPVNSGATSFCHTIVPPEGLAGMVERLLGALRFEGIFELELLELEDGRLSAIDLNPRLFGWLSLPIAAGANFPAQLCEWLLGGHSAPLVAAPGVPYRWEDGEASHLVWHLRRAHLRDAAAVLRPHRGVVHAHFQLTDPGPLAARPLHMARLWFRRRRGSRSL